MFYLWLKIACIGKCHQMHFLDLQQWTAGLTADWEQVFHPSYGGCPTRPPQLKCSGKYCGILARPDLQIQYLKCTLKLSTRVFPMQCARWGQFAPHPPCIYIIYTCTHFSTRLRPGSIVDRWFYLTHTACMHPCT